MTTDKSNESIKEAIASWEAYLKKNPNNFLKIKDVEKNAILTGHNLKNKAFFQWADILEKYEDLSSWFNDLMIKKNLSVIVVEFKRLNGTSSRYDAFMETRKYDVSLVLQELKNRSTAKVLSTTTNIQPMESKPAQPFTPTVLPAPTHNTNGYEAAVMQNMGGLGGAGMAAGMGFRELVTLEKKAEQSDFYKDRVAKLEKENAIFIIDNRELQAKVSIAEKEKNIAIKEAKQEAKNWSDPENVKALIDSVGPIMATVMETRSPAVTSELGMGAVSNLSEIKQNFIKYMNEDDCTDAQMKVLEDLLVLMITNDGYEEQLRTLVSKTNGAV